MSVRSELTSNVRERVRARLAECAGHPLPGDPVETLLMADGHYRGRSFGWDAWLAIWLTDEAALRLYHDGVPVAADGGSLESRLDRAA